MCRVLLYVVGLAFLCWGYCPVFAVEVGDALKLDHNLIPFSSGFIHYTLHNQKLQLIFLNQKKVVVPPLSQEGFVQVRFISPRKKSDQPYTLPLVPQKASLETVRPLKLPLNYRLWVTLKMKDTEESVTLPALELRPGDLAIFTP